MDDPFVLTDAILGPHLPQAGTTTVDLSTKRHGTNYQLNTVSGSGSYWIVLGWEMHLRHQ